jgi:type II secretory pathway pseudopilin PulG
MKSSTSLQEWKKAVTLIEMTVVILTILLLLGIAVPSTRWINGWQLGKKASEDLRAVFAAQRMYISDNPLSNIVPPFVPTGPAPAPQTLNDAIAGYLPPTYGGVMPTILDINDTALTINVTVAPPRVERGGARYDPSGRTNDGLWDVGEGADEYAGGGGPGGGGPGGGGPGGGITGGGL